jgi:multiple sugar transport system substrate-binding protein
MTRRSAARQASRRRFLAGGLALALLPAIQACASSPAPIAPPAQPTAAPKPAATTPPAAAAATPQAPAAAPTMTAVPKPTAPAPAKGPVSLRYGTFWPQYRLDVINLGVPTWKEQYPNVTVEIESAGGQYRDKLTTQMAAGTAPDIIMADYWSNPRYYEQKLMLNLTDYVKRDGIDIQKDYDIVALEVWCGQVMAIPFVKSTHAYNYNKNMFKQAGLPDPWDDLKGEWTWDQFRTAARTLTKMGPDGKPQVWGLSIDYTAHEYHMGPFVYSNGGETADFDQMKYTLDNPKTIEAFEFVYAMLLQDKSIIPKADAAALSTAGIADPFVGGKVAMTDDGTGRQWFWLQNIKDFEWDIAPVPVPQKGMTAISSAAGDCTNVNAKGQHREEAYAWAKFLGGPVIQGLLAKHKLLLPALKSAANSPEYLAPPPNHMSVLPDNFKRPYRPHYTHFRGLEANRAITAKLELASLGQLPLKDALMQANQEANGLVEYGSCKQAKVWVGNR